MISAAEQSTVTDLVPSRRYLLGIVNGTAGTVSPTFSDMFGTAAVVPENSTTPFTVAAGATKWLEFIAFTTSLTLNDPDALIYWTLTPAKS